ncbi:MAG: acyl-CoA/acyl-ACP dehydrogenase [Opitutales bacterium]|nr:acyl-CoA/acyl-ACP dehydrogenase [Opitutales bacterium]
MSSLPTLPGDDIRQIMWRYSDRYDLQMAVQSARQVARTTVARLVAEGERNNHEWNDKKNELLQSYDASGLTNLYMDPEQGGFIEGPKNMAMALVAFEISWVDAGAATCSLANNLALAPIHERGTREQVEYYMGKASLMDGGTPWRGAFALTEPLPFVGVDTGVLSGKIRIAEWEEGKEPIIDVEKRGRFITNMDFANFVTAAVDSDDERIKGSCMITLEEGDEGTYDRGAPTLKLVHQLSSTRDPVFRLKVPASRIIGGYEVVDGVIVPKYQHSDVIAAVFHRTRIPVGLMTSAKLLSAIEPVIRYQRQRFRGGDSSEGTPRFDMGLQMNEDVTHRLIDVWVTGEAGSSLGFAAAREADQFDPIEKQKDQYCEEQGLTGRKQFMAIRKKEAEVIEYLEQLYAPESEKDADRIAELESDILVKFALGDARANILNPGTKLWNTGYGATMMREAVTLMGGYGTTEDCPGFLGQKWMDAQLEATYEGPEAVQRRHLTLGVTSKIFRKEYSLMIAELERISAEQPDLGTKALASAMKLWEFTLDHLQQSSDANGKKLYHNKRQGVTFPFMDTLCWLIASRYFALDIVELKEKGPLNPVLAENLEAYISFYEKLSKVQIARTVGEVIRSCGEIVFGYATEETEGIDQFRELQKQAEESVIGFKLAKEQAAEALVGVMIPEALDYPA